MEYDIQLEGAVIRLIFKRNIFKVLIATGQALILQEWICWILKVRFPLSRISHP